MMEGALGCSFPLLLCQVRSVSPFDGIFDVTDCAATERVSCLPLLSPSALALFFIERPALSPLAKWLLQQLHDLDVFSEEAILQWAQDVPKGDGTQGCLHD